MVSTTRTLTTDRARARSFNQIDDLAAFDADGRLDLVTGNDRAGLRSHHFYVDAEIGKLLFDEPGGVFQRLRGQHLDIGGRLVEQVQRRQRRIRQVLEQRFLLFLDDTIGLRNDGPGWLDAYRLVLFEAFALHLDDFLALHRGLFAGFAILAVPAIVP